MARTLVHTPPTPSNSRRLSSGEGAQHKHTLEAEFVLAGGCRRVTGASSPLQHGPALYPVIGW